MRAPVVRCFLLEELLHILDKSVQFLLNDAPDDPVVNGVIAMDENVAEGDDVAVMLD